MGLFSSSKSTTTKNTTNVYDETNKTYADYSELDEGAVQNKNIIDVTDSENVNLTMLDEGAVQSAYDFSANVVEQMANATKQAVSQLTESQLAGYDVASDVVEAATEAQRSESENVWINLIKWGSIAGSILAVALVLMKSKRGKR